MQTKELECINKLRSMDLPGYRILISILMLTFCTSHLDVYPLALIKVIITDSTIEVCPL